MRSKDLHQRTRLLTLTAPFHDLWHESLICAEHGGEAEAMASDYDVTTLKRAAAFYENITHTHQDNDDIKAGWMQPLR